MRAESASQTGLSRALQVLYIPLLVPQIAFLFGLQILPFFDQYALSHRTWSADSAGISLPRVDDAGRSRIVVVPADGSEPRGVADGAIGFWSP